MSTTEESNTSLPGHPVGDAPDYYIFTKSSGCIFCDKAKELLAENALTYEERAFESLRALHDHISPMIPKERVPSFPLILDGQTGAIVGGFHHLRERLLEPILRKDSLRYSAFPIQHMDIYALYKQQVGCFWTSEEITLRDDVESFEKDLNDDERHFLSHVLGFFSQADGIVLQNLLENFMNEVQLAESKMFYSMQAFIESEHSIVYSMLIDSLIKDPFERAKLFDAIKNIQAIKEKASWALKWLDTTNTFATRLVAYACVEGILFSGSFCAIFWMKQRCNMPGLSLSNQFISRDEKLHTEHAIALYKKLLYPLPEGDVHAIIREAVEGEKSFILDALPCSLVGMNSASMGQYIEFVADRLAIDLGYSKIYGRDNPFPWMENLGLEGKTNFFEGRPSDYQRAPGVSLPLGGATEYQSLQDGASDDDDF